MTGIIDAHHHIWPQQDLPWLNGPVQPRIFGAYDSYMVDETVAIFGADRCLFGSNFPIEKIWTDYASLHAAFVAATESHGKQSQRKIFHDTAARVYKL